MNRPTSFLMDNSLTMLIAQIIKGSHDPGVTTPYSKITIKSLFSVSVYLMYGTEGNS